ncbi:MAG: hypothetical protein US60_C0047G0015 [Microgenomates group bacterium GW2011_GWC1_37_8]|nr:MAG: hypothetical protein US60_C0047G0015 [Microgenomates group bacterium GW2011_GWC1_37_8]
MLVEVRRQTIAEKIHPDFKLTSLSGIFRKSSWTDYADYLLMHQPNMEPDLNPRNYVFWLDWYYEMVSEDQSDNPLGRSIRDLSDYGIKVPWELSYTEKGFEQEIPYIDGYLQLAIFQGDGFTLERELIPDRFGDPSFVERRYKDNILSTLTTIVTKEGPVGGRMLLTIDDTKSLRRTMLTPLSFRCKLF